MESIVSVLDSIINEHGIEYLQKEPYNVYCRMLSEGVDSLHSRLILLTLLSGTSAKALEMDREQLSADIQKECCLRKKAADEMAAIYKELFEPQKTAAWKRKRNFGFREFCGRSWEFQWEGSGEWRPGGGYVDCWCDITAQIEVSDKNIAKKTVEKLLKDNPFTTAEEIFDYFSRQLSDALDEDLEDYITSDSYYPPVMEDYGGNGKYVMEECCRKMGLKLLSFECDGDMSDFEPDRGRW